MKFSAVVWLNKRCVLSETESAFRPLEKNKINFYQQKCDISKSSISSDYFGKLRFLFKILFHLKHPSICYDSLYHILFYFIKRFSGNLGQWLGPKNSVFPSNWLPWKHGAIFFSKFCSISLFYTLVYVKAF